MVPEVEPPIYGICDTSVPYGQDAEIISHFAREGYVVVTGVLSPDEVAEGVTELWDSPNLLKGPPPSSSSSSSCSSTVSRDDPTTWPWETGSQHCKRGFVESTAQHADTFCWAARQNPRVVRCFELLLGSSDLLASNDRWGVLPPTRDIRTPQGELLQRPQWASESRWLHWDQHPFLERDTFKVQGMLALTEHTESSGGFICVPQFHREFAAFSDGRDSSGGGVPYMVPPDHPAQRRACKVLMPQGSLLVWDSRLPHQNFPNSSSAFRIVMYLTYRIAEEGERQEAERAALAKLRAGLRGPFYPLQATRIGRRVLGLPEEGGVPYPEAVPEAAASLQLLQDAAEAEASGDAAAAVGFYRRAYRMNPYLEEALAG